jgi:hypothetical protein
VISPLCYVGCRAPVVLASERRTRGLGRISDGLPLPKRSFPMDGFNHGVLL